MTNPSIYSATAPSGPWPPSEDASLHSLSSACLLHPRIPRTYSAPLLARSFFCLSFPALAPLRFSRHTLFFFTGWDLLHNQPPTCRTRVPLFVGVITFDLSYLASSCSSADKLSWSFDHGGSITTPSPAGTQTGYQLASMLAVPVEWCAKYKVLTSELTSVLWLCDSALTLFGTSKSS